MREAIAVQMEQSQKTPVIALLGQPNSGKSTLFNALTGSRQRVGNWPGKTVEKKEGRFIRDGQSYVVADLPGSYSLSANSEEERITREYIAQKKADLVCILADASQLERSLYMLADYAGMDTPAILLVNLMDIATEQGKKIDTQRMESRLGIPVVPFVAADKKGYAAFYEAVDRALERKTKIKTEVLESRYRACGEGHYEKILSLLPVEGIAGYTPLWLTVKLIEGDPLIRSIVTEHLQKEEKEALLAQLETMQNGALLTGDGKFQWIEELLSGAVQGKEKKTVRSRWEKLATGTRSGKWIAIGLLFLGLIASFLPATPIMLLGQSLIKLGPGLQEGLLSIGLPFILVRFLIDVVLNTFSFAVSMIGFVFGVNFVFGLIEEIGYMARVSYVFDDTMSKFGLQGKSVMPILVSFGCTIGGAAGTRVLDNWGQKVLTIALAWAVPCAATWTIVPYLSSLYFGKAGPLIVISVFLVAAMHMVLTAKVFGPRLVKEEKSGMMMELPPYHKPKWGALLRSITVRTGEIFRKAVRVIFMVSFLFWLITYTPNGAPETTLLYQFGRAIEPVTRLFGLTWQTFLAFLSSAVSKEAALGVLSSLYVGGGSIFASTLSGGGAGPSPNLGEILKASITQAQALAFIFAVTFNVPCLMALTSTYQETRSWKWTLRIALYYMGMSLLIAFIAYRVGLLFFG